MNERMPLSAQSADGHRTQTLTPAMRRVLWLTGGVVAVALAAAVWLWAAGAGGDTGPGAAPSATNPAASPAATPGSEPEPEPTPTRGPVPGAAPTTGSEVQAPEAGQPDPGRIPPLPETTPLVGAPLPASGSAEGELVEGYPSDAMGPTLDSDVVSSAIATEGDAMQVTLVARTDASPDSVRAHYREAWTAIGLIAHGATDAAGLSYTGRMASLTLAFAAESGTGTVYTILGSFRTP